MSKEGKLKNEPATGIGFLSGWKGKAIVFAFSFFLYVNTIPNQYNLDDELVTSISPSKPHRLTSQGIGAIPEIFSEPYYSDQMGYAYDYRPMVLATFAIEHSIFGSNPHVSHFINALLYSLLCVLLYFTLSRLLKDYNPLLAFLTTLLFAAYPMHTEVVASIKNRDEMLSLAGGIGSLFFLHAYTQRKKMVQLIAAATCFAFGLLSKSTVISFIVIIPTLLILFSTPSLKQLLLIAGILCAITFPFIQKGFFDERLGMLAGVMVFLAAVYQIRRPLILNVLSGWRNALRTFINRIAAEFKPVEPADTYCLGSLTTWVILIILSVFVAGFYFLSLVNPSTPVFLYLVPLLGFFPLAVFASEKARIYITWICVAAAQYLILMPSQRIDLLIFGFLTLFFIYNLIAENKRKIQHLVMLLLMWFPGPQGDDFLNGVYQNYLMIISAASIGIAFTAYFKWFKWLTLIAVVAQVTAGPLMNIGEFKSNISVTSTMLAALIFFSPQRKGLIVWLITGGLLFLLLKDASHFQPDVHIQVPDYQRAVVPTGEYSYRPMDYVENVVSVHTPFSVRLGTGMTIIGKYMRLTVFPYPMSFYYGYKVIEKTDIGELQPLIIASLVALLVALSFLAFNKYPVLSASLLIYFLSVFPIANIFITMPGMMADRFLLIPSLGFCLLLSYLLMKLFKVPVDFREGPKASFKIIAAVILVSYIGITVIRNAQWYDTLTLMRHDIKHLGESAQAHNLLASNLVLAGLANADGQSAAPLIQEAEIHFEKAVSLYPEFFNAAYDLGRVRMMLGKWNEAESAFLRTIELDSTFATPFLQTAIVKENKKDYNGAISYYSKYLQMMPGNFNALQGLSFCYVQVRDLPAALAVAKKATLLHPQRGEPLIHQCSIFADMGKMDSARFYLHRAELIAPNHPDVIKLKNALGD